MMALASLILPLSIGWVWTEVSGALPAGRGGAARMLQAGLAVAVGFGASSLLFFLLAIAGLAEAPVLAVCEVALIAGGIACLAHARKRRREADVPVKVRRGWSAMEWLLLLGLCGCALLAAGVVARTAEAMPHGDWDAWAIWNLRARYLAGDDTWRHSVSPLLIATHPDYPLGTSSLIARTWVYGGRDFSSSVPAVIGALYGLATLLVLTGALALSHGPLVAVMGGCVLLSASSWLGEVGAQYADVPLGLYFVAAIVLLARIESANDRRQLCRGALLAGVLAGFAAGIKNEGIAFAAVLLPALAVTRCGRRNLLSYSMGVAPMLALAALFKLTIAPAADPTLSQGAGIIAGKLADLSRWGVVLSGLARRLWAVGKWYAHPLWLTVAILFALRPRERARAGYLSLWLASGMMLAAYMIVTLLTTADLQWQIATAMDRLLVQILPAMLASVLLAVRPLPGEPPPALRAGSRAAKSARKRH